MQQSHTLMCQQAVGDKLKQKKCWVKTPWSRMNHFLVIFWQMASNDPPLLLCYFH